MAASISSSLSTSSNYLIQTKMAPGQQQTHGRFQLMSLPLEVRSVILRELVCSPHPIGHRPDPGDFCPNYRGDGPTGMAPKLPTADLDLSILRTCSQLYFEARPHLFANWILCCVFADRTHSLEECKCEWSDDGPSEFHVFIGGQQNLLLPQNWDDICAQFSKLWICVYDAGDPTPDYYPIQPIWLLLDTLGPMHHWRQLVIETPWNPENQETDTILVDVTVNAEKARSSQLLFETLRGIGGVDGRGELHNLRFEDIEILNPTISKGCKQLVNELTWKREKGGLHAMQPTL